MNNDKLINIFAKFIEKYESDVDAWFKNQDTHYEPIVYTSVDIRNSGFKIAPVDVNFFPAGFNNLTQESQLKAASRLKEFLQNYDKVLLIIENHDRNINYLHNAFALQKILQDAGKNVRVANFINTEEKKFILENGEILRVDGLKSAYSDISQKYKILTLSNFAPDAVIINNDMSDGYPAILHNTDMKTFPNPRCGWFNRRKASFFRIYNELLNEFAEKFEIDPWFFCPTTFEMDNMDFKNQNDLKKIEHEVQKIIDHTQQKYDEYKIRWTQPYCFIKSNNGTYGMGVISVENAEDILNLNKKARQDMDSGKSGVKIDSIIIQEGIPTIEKIGPATAEKTIYLVNGEIVGGFFRANQGKNSRINLNSRSSFFQPLQLTEYTSRLIDFISKMTHLSASKEASDCCSKHSDIDIVNAEDIVHRLSI